MPVITAALPLGVRDDLPLSASQRKALDVIARHDLSPVRDRLLRGEALSPEVVDLMLFEFRRYLGMYAVYRCPLPMLSHAVDEAWHTTLLFSRRYAQLCEEAFGEFLHHDPADEPWDNVYDRWTEFAGLYTRLYGPLGALWENARQRSRTGHRGMHRRTTERVDAF